MFEKLIHVIVLFLQLTLMLQVLSAELQSACRECRLSGVCMQGTMAQNEATLQRHEQLLYGVATLS